VMLIVVGWISTSIVRQGERRGVGPPWPVHGGLTPRRSPDLLSIPLAPDHRFWSDPGSSFILPRPTKAGDPGKMSTSPMRELGRVLRQNGLVRFFEHFACLYPDVHLKDLIINDMGPHREMTIH